MLQTMLPSAHERRVGAALWAACRMDAAAPHFLILAMSKMTKLRVRTKRNKDEDNDFGNYCDDLQWVALARAFKEWVHRVASPTLPPKPVSLLRLFGLVVAIAAGISQGRFRKSETLKHNQKTLVRKAKSAAVLGVEPSPTQMKASLSSKSEQYT